LNLSFEGRFCAKIATCKAHTNSRTKAHNWSRTGN